MTRLIPAKPARIVLDNYASKYLKLNLSRLVIYDENNLLDALQETDTVRINAELCETIEGQILSVLNNSLDNVIVEMRYETSVSISEEGPPGLIRLETLLLYPIFLE